MAANSTDYESNARANLVAFMNEFIAGETDGNSGEAGKPDEPTPTPEPQKSEIEQARDSETEFSTTTDLEDDSKNIVWVPGGFKVAKDSETNVNNGIVIEDKKQNQFVWIPVGDEDVAEMYIIAEGTKLTGVTTTTNVYSNLRIRDVDKSNFIADKPNSNNLREPDVFIGAPDTDPLYYQDILGYESTQAMADALVAEYKAIYDSIIKYGGFYIGRYEITGTPEEPTVQKGKEALNGNWYNLKKACTEIVSTSYAQTTMVYGNQWDEVLDWIIETGEKTDSEVNIDSSSWGNYNSSTGDAKANSGEVRSTGYSEAWKANNI